MKKLILILSILLLCSCKATKTVYIPIEKKNTEYIKLIDSTYIHDSIYHFIHSKQDTVYSIKEYYRIKEILRKDTLIIRDSIPYVKEVEKIVVTNKLNKWQSIMYYFGMAYTLIMLIFLIYTFIRYKRL